LFTTAQKGMELAPNPHYSGDSKSSSRLI